MSEDPIYMELIKDVARYGEAIERQGEALDKHLNHGHVWRITIAGLALTLAINIGISLLTFGQIIEKLNHTSESFAVHVEEVGDTRLYERIAVLEDRAGINSKDR